MPRYKRFETLELDGRTQKRLGTVFLSEVAEEFFGQMLNGQGRLQVEECLQRHADGDRGLIPDDEEQKRMGCYTEEENCSLYAVGDVLEVVSDREGKTFVTLSAETRNPPAR